MLKFIMRCVFMVVCCLVTLATGSQIEFRSSPVYITEGLSKKLTLRCSLNNSVDENMIIGKRDGMDQSLYKIQYVASIVITRGEQDEHVADITTYNPATPRLDLDTLHVAGNLTTPSQGFEHGYLDLEWTNPGHNQSGMYVCEINAINWQGHSIVFTDVLQVGVEYPSEDDYIKHIHELENDNEDTKKRLSILEAAVSKFKAPHSEEGSVRCGPSYSWQTDPTHSNYKVKVLDVVFTQPYDTAPTINLGIFRLDIVHGFNTRIHTDAFNITTTGFSVRCATWDDSQVNDIAVRWTSVVA